MFNNGDAILSAIGNTPLVELKHINPNPKVRILAKLEGNNLWRFHQGPPGTVYDQQGVGAALLIAVKIITGGLFVKKKNFRDLARRPPLGQGQDRFDPVGLSLITQ